jgi:hypothetical protein
LGKVEKKHGMTEETEKKQKERRSICFWVESCTEKGEVRWCLIIMLEEKQKELERTSRTTRLLEQIELLCSKLWPIC